VPAHRVPKERICIALDTTEFAEAQRLVSCLKTNVGWFKVGLSLFCAHGRRACDLVLQSGARLFLDLKLLDIPHQVALAIESLKDKGASLLTVHCLGGQKMLEECAKVKGSLKVVGVTMLSSISDEDCAQMFATRDTLQVTQRLATLAIRSRLDGLVCSPLEVKRLKEKAPEGFMIVVPGIRGATDDKGDQARTATPSFALAKGADIIVIGRPVTMAHDPCEALSKLLEQ
jgi:orotidine-5'-phosphate decarboxylase